MTRVEFICSSLALAAIPAQAVDVPSRAIGHGIKPKEMMMMSFNVRMGCGLNDPFKLPQGSLGHLPQCAEVIKSVNPDWVAIQEFDCSTVRAGGDRPLRPCRDGKSYVITRWV